MVVVEVGVGGNGRQKRADGPTKGVAAGRGEVHSWLLQKLELVGTGVEGVLSDVRQLTDERDNIRATFDDLTVKLIRLQVGYHHIPAQVPPCTCRDLVLLGTTDDQAQTLRTLIC